MTELRPESNRRHSPAAERNRDAILEQLRVRLPETGRVLEIASGTGQHVAYFATHLKSLVWRPSDVEPTALASIREYVAAADVANVEPPIELDVCRGPWPVTDVAAIVCSNMIHIAPWEAAIGLMQGAGASLPPGGGLHLYGPFKRNGEHTSPSNAAFDESLRARNPLWGVRDLDAVVELAARHGFDAPEVTTMPANNLLVSFTRRPD